MIVELVCIVRESSECVIAFGTERSFTNADTVLPDLRNPSASAALGSDQERGYDFHICVPNKNKLCFLRIQMAYRKYRCQFDAHHP